MPECWSSCLSSPSFLPIVSNITNFLCQIFIMMEILLTQLIVKQNIAIPFWSEWSVPPFPQSTVHFVITKESLIAPIGKWSSLSSSDLFSYHGHLIIIVIGINWPLYWWTRPKLCRFEILLTPTASCNPLCFNASPYIKYIFILISFSQIQSNNCCLVVSLSWFILWNWGIFSQRSYTTTTGRAVPAIEQYD